MFDYLFHNYESKHLIKIYIDFTTDMNPNQDSALDTKKANVDMYLGFSYCGLWPRKTFFCLLYKPLAQ